LPTLEQIRAERARREAEHELQRKSEQAQATRERCTSLVGFVREAWHVLEPNSAYAHGWHIDAICDHLEAITAGCLNRLLINVPPGMMKSLLVSVFWPAWEWGPRGLASLRYLASSYSENYVKRDSRRMRDLVASEWYQALWGDKVRLVRAGELSFANEATGFREGVPFPSLTGGRGDRVIIDDPHSTETAESEAERARTARIFRESVPTRLNDPATSAIVIIMQRLHANDVSGVALALKLGYDHLCMPMEFEASRRCRTSIGFEDPRSEEGELLFPERFPADVVQRDKVPLGQYGVAGQFQQRPAPRDGGLFKRAWFGEPVLAAPPGTRWVRHWDLAASKKRGSGIGQAATAGVKLGQAPDGAFYVGHVLRLQDEGHEVRKAIRSTAAADGVQVEVSLPQDPGQAGKVQASDLVAMLAGYVVHAEPETGDKVTRAEPIAAQAAAGNLRLVKGDWNEAFLDEVGNFPSGSHKDQVDALSGAFGRLLKRTNSIFSMPLAEIGCEPFAIPSHWPRVYALDLDWQRVSAVWAACDSESQVVYLYSEYSARRAELAIHAEAIRSRGKEVRGFLNPVAHGRSHEEGVQLINELWKRDLSLMASSHAPEVSLGEMANLLGAQRLRVFNTLIGWTSEYPLYRRDDKGRPNDDECPLLASTALLSPIAPGLSPEDDYATDNELWANQGRSAFTGY
jgi:predicted phage terminase large subunit-like protein